MSDDPTAADDPSERPLRDPFDGPDWHRPSRRSRTRSEAEPDAARPPVDAVPVEAPDEPDDHVPAAEGELRVRRERRRRSKYAKRKRRRRLALGGGIFSLLVLAAVGWLLYTGLRARHELEIVRADVKQLRSEITAGNLTGARATAEQLRSHADEAHNLTTGPLWASSAAVPWAGRPLESARTITTSVDEVAGTALPELVTASRALNPSDIRRPDGSVDLAAMASVAPTLDDASTALVRALREIQAAPSSTWLGSVDAARSDLIGQLDGLGHTVQSADVAARVLPSMLGADGPRSYMIGFQNEAEVRGTGGLPGAFAILQVDNGSFHFTNFESDNVLNRQPTGIDYGTAFDQQWSGANVTSDYRDSNVSPHFPYAAQIWAAQWQASSGQKLDGAITLDPTALSYLLKVAGPTKTPDGTIVNADNVVALTQSEAYQRFATNNDARKQFLLDVAKAVSQRLLRPGVNTTALVRAAADAAGQHRLLVWARDPSVEAELSATTISGVVPDNSAPYAGVAMNNAGANKLDYFTDATMDIRRASCGSQRQVTVTMTLRNGAPDNLSNYMYGQYGRRTTPKTRGDNRTLVTYYATKGAQMTSVTLNGKPFGATPNVERGHPIFTLNMELPRGVTQTVVLHLTEPDVAGPLTLRPQPLVRPMKVRVEDGSCAG